MQMIYFDHASTSRPKPPEVLNEIASYLTNIGVSPGRGGYTLAHVADALVQEVRSELAALLHVTNPDLIAFTHNGTHAINIVLKGCLQEGDHVIISNFEHHAVVRPLHKLAREKRITYSVWSSDAAGHFQLESLQQLICPNTRLIVVNHASNVLGVLSPVRHVGRLAQERGIPLLVDVAQTAGLFPVDFGDCADYITGTGHKSLLGPSGIGFLYAKNPDGVATLYEGGGGSHSLSLFHPEVVPDKFESGTLNYMGIAGLKGSLSYLKKYGVSLMRQRVMELAQQAIVLLQTVPNVTMYGTQVIEQKVPLISFNLTGFFSNEVGYILNQHGICVRSGLHCAPLIHRILGTLPHGTVRLSLGHQNTCEEINYLCDVLRSMNEGSYEKISAR